MKTITIKLPDQVAEELDLFVKRKSYITKSEFIRNIIMEKVSNDIQEKLGLLALAEKSLEKLWKNKKDDEVWSKYV